MPPQTAHVPPWHTSAVALQESPGQHAWLAPPQLPHSPPLQIWLLPGQIVPSLRFVQAPAAVQVLQAGHEGLPLVQQVSLVTHLLPHSLRPSTHLLPVLVGQGMSGAMQAFPHWRYPSLQRKVHAPAAQIGEPLSTASHTLQGSPQASGVF